MHHQSVFSHLVNIRGNIERKTGVAIHVVSQTMTVEPDGGTMIHAIEMDADLFVLREFLLIFCREREVLGIDALSSCKITSRATHLGVEGKFDAPVVGDGYVSESLA